MKCPKVPIKSKKMLPRYSSEELALLAKRVGLNLEQLKQIHAAANATYQAIGHDLQQCRAECGEPGASMSREETVEVVLDANYIEQYGGPAMNTPEMKEWLRTKATKYKLEHVYEAVAAAFPFSEYE